MKTFTYILLLFGLLISIHAFSCSCDTPNVLESFDTSDNIFVGIVIKSEFYEFQDTLFDSQVYQNTDFKYTVLVQEMFKGDSLKEIVVLSDNGSSCHFPLKHGETYLIYSNNWRGLQRTNMCTRTKSFQDSLFDYDYKILRQLKKKVSENSYRTGLYISDDNYSYFKFFPSGKFYYRNAHDGLKHGIGKYQFIGDSLIVEYDSIPQNNTSVNQNFHKENIDSLIIKVNISDYDLQNPIQDFHLTIKNKNDSILFSRDLTDNEKVIKLDKKSMPDSLFFSKANYPVCSTDYYQWEDNNLHEFIIRWQEKFEAIKKQSVAFKLKKDEISNFVIEDKVNTGYNSKIPASRVWLLR